MPTASTIIGSRTSAGTVGLHIRGAGSESSASARVPIGGGVQWASRPIESGARLELMGTGWGICPVSIRLIGHSSGKFTRAQ